jgi:diguanylate cyclase (GGDEF)-like protein
MPNTFVQFVLAITILLLFASMWTIFRIRRIIQQNLLRAAWACLGITLLMAAFGYLVFLYTNDIEGDNHHEDWLIAFTLFIAAVFIFGVCAVSLFSARELARIDDLEKAAFFDPITNLYTRGHIDSLLTAECERSRSETRQLSLMLLDLDNFKFINDCFGHKAGDYVLQEVGRILKQTVDPSNLIGRYGGEEFLIVLPNTSPILAVETADRIRSTMSAARLEFEGNVIPVTISIGVKNNFTFREEAQELVAAADTAMYEAKRRGRNQVIMADVFPVAAFNISMGGAAGLMDTEGENLDMA